MMHALALILVQKSAADTFSTFVEESAAAVLSVKPGFWTMNYVLEKSVQTVAVGPRQMKARIVKDGKLAYDFANSSTNVVSVDYGARTFSQATFTEEPETGRPDPLPPLEPDQLDLKLASDRGLVFRTNPPVDQATVSLKNGVETLDASLLKRSGKRSTIRLTRDAKTKWPIHFQAFSAETGKTMIVEFKFEKRPPTLADLTIAPESHAGFREVPFGSGG